MFYWSIGITAFLLVTWLSREIIKFHHGGVKAHTDVLKYEPSNAAWTVDYCFSITNNKHKTLAVGLGDPTNCMYNYSIGDVNMDGKADVILIEHNFNGTGKSYLHVYYSTGSDFVNGLNTTLNYDFTDYDFNFVNMAGDAGGELIIYGAYAQNNKYIFQFSFTEQLGTFGYLKKIANGYNQEVIFTYATSSDANSGYTTTENLGYPYATLNAPFRFVKNIQETNGVGGYNLTEYSYENGTASRLGKGFLGFKKASVYSRELRTKTISTFSLDAFPMLLPSTKKIMNDASGTTLLSTETYHNGLDQIWSGAKATWMVKPLVSPNSSTVVDNLTGVTVTNTLTVDDYGNLVTKVSDNGVEKISCNYTYDNTKIYTVPHLLTEELKAIERGGPQNYNQRKAIYTYNANHLPVTKIERPEPDPNGKAVTTAFEYYATGNLKKKTTNAAGAATITESFEYDANFVNIDKTTNPLQQSSFVSYDAIYDVPKTTTDISGLVTSYTYDGWQRPVSIKYPNNVTATKKTEWVASGDLPTGQQVNVSTVIYKITEILPGKPTVITYYDILNRAVLTQTQGFSHTLFVGVEYNEKGQKQKTTNAYSTTASVQVPVITRYNYNGLNQLTSEISESGGTQLTTTYSHTYGSGNYTWTANPPDGKKQVKVTDASGKIISTEDNGGTIIHTYTLNGSNNTSVHKTTVGGVVVTTAEFDEAGHQTKLDDQAAGLTTYSYNPYGQLIYQKDANQKAYEMSYDNLGRITSKQGEEGVYTYTYETTTNGLNQLKKLEGPGNVSYSYTYDNLQRLTKIAEAQPTQTFETKYKYDAFGNRTEITYPNNFAIIQDYNDNGYMTAIRNKNDGATIWQGVSTNELGQFTSYVTGNHKATARTYTNFGQPVEFNTAGVQQLEYNFNATTGNLDSRTTTNPTYNYTETFAYNDNLKRLNGWSHTLSNDNFGMSYDDFGRFNTKFDAGDYTYNNQLLQSVTGSNSAIPLMQQDLTFNEFRKPATIGLNNNLLTYTYGPDQQRTKGVWTDASAQTYRTRYYATNYELTEEGLAADRHTYQVAYINSPTGLCAMYVKKDNGQGELHYTYTDYLGSILVVTNKDGATEADQNFDAWGRHRDPATLQYTTLQNIPVWLYRGYTGHEMLPEFGLINMNARLYDPILGVMLGPDNEVQAPNYTQSYNRYTYCFNNPLKYTDPSGNDAVVVAGMIIGGVAGGYIGGVAANHGEWNPLQWNYGAWQTYGGIVAGAAVGILVGAVVGAAIANPATISLAVGWAPRGIGFVGLIASGGQLSFGYSNSAGSGSVPLNNAPANTSGINMTAVNQASYEQQSVAQNNGMEVGPSIRSQRSTPPESGMYATYYVSENAYMMIRTKEEYDRVVIYDVATGEQIVNRCGFATEGPYATIGSVEGYLRINLFPDAPGDFTYGYNDNMHKVAVFGIVDNNTSSVFDFQMYDSNPNSTFDTKGYYNKNVGYNGFRP